MQTTARIVVVVSVVLVVSGCQTTVQESSPQRFSMIVQADDLNRAAAAVVLVGGEVTHEFAIIEAVGALLTPSQIDTLRRIEGIQLYQNRRVATAASGSKPDDGDWRG